MTQFPFIVEGSGNLAEYLAENKPHIDQALAGSGAVLLRGFDVGDAYAFDQAVCAYGEAGFTYARSLSNAVRVNVTERVFTANEAPPSTEIFLHHEMAQTPIYPGKLFFYCEIAADQGGATPLCRSDLLYAKLCELDPENAKAFETLGVRYSNIMPAENDHNSGQGRSWRSTLGVETREEAQARLKTLDYDWEWQDDNALRVTTPVLPAVRDLGDGKKSFFNQLIAAARGWSDKRNDPARAIRFGDDQLVSKEHLAQAIALSDDLTYDHYWQAGDVVLVDNYSVMHGRRPFSGKRRVLASLIN